MPGELGQDHLRLDLIRIEILTAGLQREGKKIGRHRSTECDCASAASGERFGQINHRRNTDAAAHQQRQSPFGRQREAIAERTDDIDGIARVEPAEPIGSDTDHAMDDVQFDARRHVAASGKGKRTPQKRNRRLQLLSNLIYAPAKPPFAVHFDFTVEVMVATRNLNELSRFRVRESFNPQYEPEVFSTKVKVRQDD